jgi:hypothetical protein
MAAPDSESNQLILTSINPERTSIEYPELAYKMNKNYYFKFAQRKQTSSSILNPS